MSTDGLHRYTVEHRIGLDASGELFLATQRSPDRREKQVLVSCMPAPETSPDSPPAQLMREHVTSSSLHHSAILQVLDAGRHEDIYFMIFEYLEGPDLEDLLARTTARGMVLPIDVVLHIGRQIAAALSYAHSQPHPPSGAVAYHGSLYPARVHLSTMGTVKTRGFGAGPAPLRYRCPEQLRAPAGSKAGDLFALGTLLFECLCGEVPFDGSTEHEIREALAACRVPPLRTLRPEIPDALERLITRCLHDAPTDRYPCASDLLQDLASVMRYRRVSSGAALLADFVGDAFPERGLNSGSPPVARGSTPDWERLCHRLSPRLVELPRSLEEGRRPQVRLIPPGKGSEARKGSSTASTGIELPGG